MKTEGNRLSREELLAVAKPILFNTLMVQAILDGRKTVTRRIIRPPYFVDENDKTILTLRTAPIGSAIYKQIGHMPYPDSPYKVGDYLYVRETWRISNFDYDDYAVYVEYKAGYEKNTLGDAAENCGEVILPEDKFQRFYDNCSSSDPDWHPSIHMPKEAARVFLRVTDIRVKRLQDMWASDVTKEGIYFTKPHTADEMIAKFEDLWNSTISKKDLDKYGWKANPWVWVIEFETVEVRE